ncbi:hypothetical protein SH2C18_13300 [Clostridium sediminicola]|uniref:ABC transporter permease n=1 Tax=Clostridium sediminicola TaxID=3114879 RepID=UPI0031F21E85
MYTDFVSSVLIHIKLSFSSLIIAIFIGGVLGILAYKSEILSAVLITMMNFLRMIPTLLVLALMLPYIGIGFFPAFIALVILAVPPILINFYTGFKNIDEAIIEAAKGMGMDEKNLFFKVELPQAAPIILGGIKTASIEIVSAAALSAVIGAGGLGDYILTGLSIADPKYLLLGAVPISIIAIITTLLFDLVHKKVVKTGSDSK